MRVAHFRATSSPDKVRFAVTLDEVESHTPDDLSAVLVAHTETESFWTATFPITRTPGSSVWSGEVAWGAAEAPNLLSLNAIQVPSNPAQADASIDPQVPTPPESFPIEPPAVLRKPSAGETEWADGEEALDRLVRDREKAFDAELFAPGATSTDSLWTAVVLAEHILLTAPTRVPGLRVMPLNRESNEPRLRATSDLLTALTVEIGMSAPGAINFPAADRPLAIVLIPKLRSPNEAETIQEAAQLARRVLDVIGLNRGDSPALLAAAVGLHQADGTVAVQAATTLDRRYSGNLIGGMISGESVTGLNNQWRHAQGDPRVFLWLRLFNEALADPRWDYRVFRCFNLLEGVAKEVIPKNQPVLDAAGLPRMQVDGKKPYTAGQARGAVFLLLEKCGHLMPHVGQQDGTSKQADLWDETGLWVAIRNEVAHTGSWDQAPSQNPTPAWTRHNARLATDMERATVVRDLQSAAETVLHSAFRASL